MHSRRRISSLCTALPKRANPTPCLHPLVHASPTTTPGPSQPTPMSPPPCQKPITPTPDLMQWLLAIHLLTLARQHSNDERPFSHTMWSLLIWWQRDRSRRCRGSRRGILNLVSVMLVVVWTADFGFCAQISDPSHAKRTMMVGCKAEVTGREEAGTRWGFFFHFNCLTKQYYYHSTEYHRTQSLTSVNIF